MTDNRSPQVTVVMAVLLVLTWVAMLLRAYVRLHLLRSFGTDDWLATAALALFTVYGGFVFLAVKHGIGKHVHDLPEERVTVITRDFYILECLFFPTTAVIKLSVSALLLRIAVQRKQRYIVYLHVVITVVFGVIATVLSIFACRPIQYFWLRYDPRQDASGQCAINSTGMAIVLYVYVGVAVVTDFTFAILPWYIIRESSLTPRDKVSIIAVLGMGMLAGISAVVRTPYIHNIQISADITYNTADLTIWGTLEPGLGLIAASMCTLRPLFRTFFSKKRLFGSVTPTGHSGWPGNRGYVRSTANTHVLRTLSGREKDGDVYGVRSNRSVDDSDFSDGLTKKTVRNGSTRGLVVHQGSFSGGGGHDVASEEEAIGTEWEAGIMKTTEFSVQTEGVRVGSAI